jgi:hypothetical protein
LDTVIYIPDSSSQSDPARSIGVDGWGVWCVFVSGLCFELVDGWGVMLGGYWSFVLVLYCYYILYLILYSPILLIYLLSHLSLLSPIIYPSSSPLSPPNIHSILVGTYIYLFILSSRTIWPRTFYRSGWLRCDVFNCVVFGLCFELVLGLTLGV